MHQLEDTGLCSVSPEYFSSHRQAFDLIDVLSHSASKRFGARLLKALCSNSGSNEIMTQYAQGMQDHLSKRQLIITLQQVFVRVAWTHAKT